ncbi:thermonuclease family protein [Auritidibacter ignavus]|uniref:thermonuclease family protein n=1 Tax=Auritidibacter TaxID=1160973 RepID=UPI000D73D87A|nr:MULTISPECIES: thermonuclease family protein [Auritidibacter]AXR74181.1 hypothetical protein DCC27_007640 [Auritidibacter sp. NML130574]PXA79946.1 hypothetical protein DCC25_07640 [Auritidibacter sp. NML120636]WGH80658.1 thermonuclease family protein [Auritidibacter ignavus]WGH86008.1 thermonuclease family protein [Auritidibacter ignavus]WGH88294.1 thermonuclease family protein [Auritidibacter ignavus]
MSSNPRRKRRINWSIMILLTLVALVLLTLTVLTVVRNLAQDEDSARIDEVLTGQSMQITANTGEQVVRMQAMRAPVPPEDDASETLDTCLHDEAKNQLEQLAPAGSTVNPTYPAYPNAPNGEVWADLEKSGDDLALEMVRSGYAVPYTEEAQDDARAQEFNEARQQAFEAKRGIYSKDADCTLPSQIEPVLEELEEIPDSNLNDLQETSEYIATLNGLQTEAQQARSILAAIPTTGESVSALAWGQLKETYMEQIEESLSEIESKLSEAQQARASMSSEDGGFVPEDSDEGGAGNAESRPPSPDSSQPEPTEQELNEQQDSSGDGAQQQSAQQPQQQDSQQQLRQQSADHQAEPSQQNIRAEFQVEQVPSEQHDSPVAPARPQLVQAD